MALAIVSVTAIVLGLAAVGLALAYALEKQKRQFLDQQLTRAMTELGVQQQVLQSQQQAAQSSREVAMEQRSLAMEQLVSPLQQSLLKMDERLESIERSRLAMTSSLTEQVRQLGVAQESLRSETSTLARALRQPSARGRWGELQLKRVAELAGMLEHCDFELQTALTNSRGSADPSVQRPDMIVNLPQGRKIAVDAKVPLSAFLQAEEATTEDARKLHLREHARAVRGHVQALSRRAYWEQLQPAPDLVVLFLPGEHFYAAALLEDPTLLESASADRVVIATPTTLIALLKAVSFGWQQERIAENARHMADLGRELTKRLGDAFTHTQNLGKLLSRTVEGYNKMVGSYEARVMPAARRIAESSGAGSGPEPLQLIDVAAKRGGSNDDQDLPNLFSRKG